jgi:hypothetical protein
MTPTHSPTPSPWGRHFHRRGPVLQAPVADLVLFDLDRIADKAVSDTN